MAGLDKSVTPENGESASVGAQTETIPEIILSTAMSMETLTDGLTGETPILNRDGTLRKKPGRKPGQKNGTGAAAVTDTATPIPATPATPQTPHAKKAVRLASDQTARAILNTVVGVMCEAVGPEWDFVNQAEADGMRIALAAYVEAKGGGEMSPELAMLLVTSGYALPRMRHENTRTKLANFFGGTFKAIRSVFTR